MNAPAHSRQQDRSPFRGRDVCSLAGLPVQAGMTSSQFDDDSWEFFCVDGIAVQMKGGQLTWPFHKIENRAWRMVAKDYLMALMAPGHEAVRVLPDAYRIPRGIRSCRARLVELMLLFRWLAQRGVTGLADLTQDMCDAYIEYRSFKRDKRGQPVAPMAPTSVATAYTVLIDLSLYADLFTADVYPHGFRPWKGRTAGAVSGRSSDRGNKTQPVPMELLQPLLTAALYVAGTLGGHVVALRTGKTNNPAKPGGKGHRGNGAEAVRAVIRAHHRSGEPFVAVPPQFRRRNGVLAPDDPLARVSLRAVAAEAGFSAFYAIWMPLVRHEFEQALADVGVEQPIARDAALVPTADGSGAVPWTTPLHGRQAFDLACYVRAACLLVVSALTGMRSSELMELRRGCAAEQPHPAGVTRYQVTGKLIKRQPLGGKPEQWIVIEPVYRALLLAEQLADNDDELIFGRISPDAMITNFRNWVSGPAGSRLGLAPIPHGVVNLQMLRRRLAIELAYRPGGLLAAKVGLKHISVVTTEGYANRPGGAQAKLLAEVAAEEEQRNLTLVQQAFDDYRNGVMPSGPGARELVAFFESVDGAHVHTPAGAPAVTGDQTLRGLLAKRATTLHIGTANYCWFTDPSKALCLKLAGRTDSSKPLAGLCDSARCPQATHHQEHRPVWAGQAETTKVFIGGLSRRQDLERRRLNGELDRIERVIAEIDTATGTAARTGEKP